MQTGASKPRCAEKWRGSSRERRTAAAGGSRVRILDHELRTFQTFLIIDFRADEVLVAHRIDQERHSILVHPCIVFGDILVEGEAVLEAGAAAAADEHPQLELRIAFL